MNQEDGSQMKGKLLALNAESENDLVIISALTQDSILKKKNIKWQKKRHRFSMLLNRFRWELMHNEIAITVPFKRAQTVLTFDGVLHAFSKGLDHALENEILSLLNIRFESGKHLDEIELIFAGKTAILLKIELLRVSLQDLEIKGGVGSSIVPAHKI